MGSFSDAIAKIAVDPALANRLGTQGKYLVENKFNEYAVADRVEEIYTHVLKNKIAPFPAWELDIG